MLRYTIYILFAPPIYILFRQELGIVRYSRIARYFPSRDLL